MGSNLVNEPGERSAVFDQAVANREDRKLVVSAADRVTLAKIRTLRSLAKRVGLD